jgi:3-methyladenine DNA glycosylase AlkD
LPETKQWAKSPNKWFRRASTVVLIYSLRRGKYLKSAFDAAKILLRDDEDLVQKGYGWTLKEASKFHQKEVFDFIIKNKKLMSRTALRYAIEKLPEKMKVKARKKISQH